MYNWEPPYFEYTCPCGKKFKSQLKGLSLCDECMDNLRKEIGLDE